MKGCKLSNHKCPELGHPTEPLRVQNWNAIYGTAPLKKPFPPLSIFDCSFPTWATPSAAAAQWMRSGGFVMASRDAPGQNSGLSWIFSSTTNS